MRLEDMREIILNLAVCILLRVLDQVQVQGFRLTQHYLNTATCFGRMTISMVIRPKHAAVIE
jgi:hypothetical protein